MRSKENAESSAVRPGRTLEPWTEGTTTLEYYSRSRPYGEFLDGDDWSSGILRPPDPVARRGDEGGGGAARESVLPRPPSSPPGRRAIRASGSSRLLEILDRHGVTHILVAHGIATDLAPIQRDLRQVFEGEGGVLLRYDG